MWRRDSATTVAKSKKCKNVNNMSEEVLGLRLNGFMMGKRCIFFFKQKTAYEIMPSLVGSEVCI